MAAAPKFIKFNDPAVPHVNKVVDPTSVIDGDPAQKSWLFADIASTGTRSGMWDCQAGSAEITNLDDDTTKTVQAGDAFVMEPGLRTKWVVKDYIKKHFVITDLR